MNKHQKALNNFYNYAIRTNDGCFHSIISNDKAALQELVDRATPKKVDASKVITVYDYSTNQYETIVPCPNCANNIPFDNGFKFCPHCGQALDWGDEK